MNTTLFFERNHDNTFTVTQRVNDLVVSVETLTVADIANRFAHNAELVNYICNQKQLLLKTDSV
jgi:hypothetical protein